tara:strand:+ start:10 stop:912 length:903 start_codon:yes stop_codon:yes gene_type:complete
MSDEKIILPKDQNLSEEEQKTDRALKREIEDEAYIPVILKRTDESVRHPDDVLEKAIHEGIEQHKRSALSLLLSAVSAGLILGFAAMSVALASQIFPSNANPLYNRLAMAFVYPLGFIICIMSGTQLFTEHTATAVYPVLDKKASIQSLFRLWIIVLVGNFIGTSISSVLIFSADSVILAKEGVLEVAHHLTSYTFKEVFISAILAGWLMAQGGWLILATPPTSSQILCIYIVTFIIGIGGLHHSIAGSAEIFGGLLLSEDPHYKSAFITLFASILGNLVGGSVFVGILNYAHIRKTQEI